MKKINRMKRYSFYRCSILLLMVLFCLSCKLASRDAAANKNSEPLGSNPSVDQVDTLAWKKEAKRMVNDQLVARGITDRKVLKAMENTPRHRFMPQTLRQHAYYDGPLPIGEEQTISQPYIVAVMTELLKLKGQEKVLEIGTGSGYQAAILSQLADTCYSIELIKTLSDRATKLLKEMGYHNVVTKWGDGYKGWPEHAPFDRIIITAAPEEVPQALVDQLKVEGIMVVPVGKTYQELLLITKTDKGIRKKTIFPVRFVPMVKPD